VPAGSPRNALMVGIEDFPYIPVSHPNLLLCSGQSCWFDAGPLGLHE
jgi:hypothetical protein